MTAATSGEVTVPPGLGSGLPLPSAAVHLRTDHVLPAALYGATDVAVALTVLIGVFVATNLQSLPGGLDEFLAMRVTVKNVVLLGAFCAAWPLAFAALELYAPARRGAARRQVPRVVAACTLGSLVTLIFPFTSESRAFGFDAVAWFWAGSIAASVGSRWLLAAAAESARPADRRSILIVGSGPRALRLFRDVRADLPPAWEVVGFVDTVDRAVCPELRGRLLGPLAQLEAVLMRDVIDEVFIALPIKSCYEQIQWTIATCERVGVQARYLSDFFDRALARPRYGGPSRGDSIVTLAVAPDDWRLVVKRFVDVAGAAVALLAVMPLMLCVAAAIALDSPGPVLFAQERYGRNKRRFRMYKFRTMCRDAEAQQSGLEARNEATGPIFKLRDDPRITRVGRLLRRTSLDELPQLVNVLRGEMSLVGPRPMSVRDASRLSEARAMRRFSVRPGMTGLWQVSGRSNLPFDRWVALDLQYIDEWSLRLDAKILALTVPVVLRGSGAM